jgi:hypothetical protein
VCGIAEFLEKAVEELKNPRQTAIFFRGLAAIFRGEIHHLSIGCCSRCAGNHGAAGGPARSRGERVVVDVSLIAASKSLLCRTAAPPNSSAP